MVTLLMKIGTVALAVAVALLLAVLVDAVLARGGRRARVLARLSARTRVPLRAFAVLLGLDIGLREVATAGHWWSVGLHAADIVCIAAGAFLVTSLLFVAQEGALHRYRTDVVDNRHARAVHTQITVVRRLTVAVVAIIAVAAVLMTFRTFRLIGSGLLASAGVTAAIAAFALNTMLGNVIAGLQIAFGGSVRLEDVVVINGEWGRVEEITLTYVVVHLWDDRRLILPTSYLTTQPFENWTRTSAALLGEVTLEVDWTVSLDAMREWLRGMLGATSLWDGRVSVVQAVDAAQGRITVRALVSAKDAPTLWDLRCVVREGLISWVRESGALPRVRTDPAVDGGAAALPRQHTDGVARDRDPGRAARAGSDDRVFSGDRESRERGESFTGPADQS